MPFFTPPTHEEPIRTTEKPLCYYRLTWAASVVRDGATFRTVRSPSAELLEAAGVEGTDYFIGGYEYTVTDEVAAELVLAGYTVS